MSDTNGQAEEVIDLTDSFTLVNHRILSNTVIDLLDSDESFIKSPVAVKKKRYQHNISLQKKQIIQKEAILETKDESSNCLLCPICWEKLGKSSVAATICGHVFCMKCLKDSLKINKKCPTCRNSLKGSSAYHQLYLGG